MFGRWGGLGLRRRDWSHPVFSIESVMGINTVWAVGRGGWAAAGDEPGATPFGAGGVLAHVSRASMVKRTVEA